MADARKPALYRAWDPVLEQFVIYLFETDASQVKYQNGVFADKDGEEVAIYIVGLLDAHIADGDKHLNATRRGLLDTDVPVLKLGLADHIAGNTGTHVTTDWANILEDLEKLTDVPSEIFATKDELNQLVAGLTLPPLQVEDITARDALKTAVPPVGKNQWVWVVDPIDDDANITGPGTALYIFDGTDFLFIMQLEGVVIPPPDWNQMINGPASTAAQIDAAVGKAHGPHANMTTLEGLGGADAFGLTFMGEPVTSGVHVGDEEPPTGPFPGQVWIDTSTPAPVEP